MVTRAARALLDAGADECLVVLGARGPEVAAALEGLPVETLTNPRWEEGMGTSIAAGVGAARGDACLIALADQPGVDAALLRELMDTARTGHARVAARYAGTLGVPAVFSGAEDLRRLRELAGDQGAKSLCCGPAPSSPSKRPRLPSDIDTQADWDGWRRSRGGTSETAP